MKQNVLIHTFLLIFTTNAFCSGFDIKTSSVIDQPGIEVLGEYNNSWYLIGFEKPGRVNEPPRYKLFKYAAGFPSAKTSAIYASFGEKTIYLKTAFINNKVSVFYGKCERWAEVQALCDSREGHKQIPIILRQDYDPNTLEPVGAARVVFNRDEVGFAASGIDIVESDDKSKTAILMKCYYKEHNYKIILTDNNYGQIYAKVFSLKSLKQYLTFGKLKVGNNGQLLIQAKTRDDIITLSQNATGARQIRHYFFSINENGNEPVVLTLNQPVEYGKFINEPVIALLNDGSLLIAYDILQEERSAVVKSILVSKYDVNFNLLGKKEVIPDQKFVSLAANYQEPKKENGLPYLEIQEVLPLEGAGFMLICEYNHTIENHDNPAFPLVKRCYLLTCRINDKMEIKDFHFMPKKQISSSISYAFSARAYRKGNDVFLFHNDDWEIDGEHGMDLQCTLLAANGAEPETQKIIHTSNDFFTSMKRLYPASDGKVLFTEEKLVDFESVSREVKLLEVTPK